MISAVSWRDRSALLLASPWIFKSSHPWRSPQDQELQKQCRLVIEHWRPSKGWGKRTRILVLQCNDVPKVGPSVARLAHYYMAEEFLKNDSPRLPSSCGWHKVETATFHVTSLPLIAILCLPAERRMYSPLPTQHCHVASSSCCESREVKSL